MAVNTVASPFPSFPPIFDIPLIACFEKGGDYLFEDEGETLASLKLKITRSARAEAGVAATRLDIGVAPAVRAAQKIQPQSAVHPASVNSQLA